MNTITKATKEQTMKTATVLALLIAVLVSACGQEPLPGEDPAQGNVHAGDATPTPSSTADAMPPADATPTPDATPPDTADRCAIPDGYILVLRSCTYTAASNVCIAQNSEYFDAPPGTIKINLAGCHLDARPNVVCVDTCPPN